MKKLVFFVRIFLFLFVSFFSSSVFADTYPSTTTKTYSGYSSPQAFCDAMYGAGASTASASSGSSGTCFLKSDSSTREGWSNEVIAYSCPYGGSLSADKLTCINATACASNQMRDSTGMCVAAVTCWDGSQAQTFGQCPVHTCPNIVQGSMVIKQTWNDTACVNSDITYCDLQLQIPDAVSGGCLPKPNAVDCGNGVVVISPVSCPAPRDHSGDITCPDGLIISPPRTCALIPPDKSQCPPGVETTGYFQGVPTCIMADGSKTPAGAPAAKTPSGNYNPQGYSPGVACNASYSFPCDPGLPVTPALPGVSGIENCGAGTFFTCADAFTPPVRPSPNAAPTSSSTPQTTTGTTTNNTTTNTVNNSTGSTSTTTGTSTTTSTVSGTGTMDCPTCAKESTLLHLSGQLTGLAAGTGKGVVNGTGSDVFDNALPDNAVIQAKTDYQAKFSQVQASIKGMFSFSGVGGGSLPSFDFGMIKGVHVQADLNRYSSQLSYVGLTIMFIAAFLAVLILLG